MRGNRAGECDLLILRQYVHMRPSVWPAVLARLKHGTLLTMRDPPPRDPRPGVPDPVVREHSATFMMVGDPACRLSVGDELTRCGERVVHHRDIRRYGGPAFLGRINGDNDGGWECMILAEDRIFRGMVRRSV